MTEPSHPGDGPSGPDPVQAALDGWLRRCLDRGCPPRVPAVRAALADAVGRVTAEPVRATRSSPGFDASAMDGIAVDAAAVRRVPPGADGAVRLPAGAYDVVDTGDPLPAGRDAVVIREQVGYFPATGTTAGTAGTTGAADRPEAVLAAGVPAGLAAYRHVRPIGEDVVAGELLLPAGHRLRAVDVAAAAAAGAVDLLVHRQPVVAVLATGDEIRPIGTPTGPGEILDTNSLMIAAQLRGLGCQARVLPIEPDDPARIAAAVAAATGWADLVVLVAGASAGRDDHAVAVIGSLGEVVVHGVAVRPGHPVVLGVAGGTPVLGCPGYPVSAALTVELFAAPLLAALEGAATAGRPRVAARLGSDLGSVAGAQDWVRVRLAQVRDDLVVTPLSRRAGALTSLVRADGLLPVPVGVDRYPAGRRVDVQLLRDLDEVRRTLVLAGPHDHAVDLLVNALRAQDPRFGLTLSATPSTVALAALDDGLCHLAGWTLDDGAGLDRAGHPVRLVRLADRELGLVTAPGNPRRLRSLEDLARPGIRFVNRPVGTGSRALLDRGLDRLGIRPELVDGYAREARSHLAVAAAVAAGRADCGLAVRAAAVDHGLDLVPLATLPYHLVVPADLVDLPLLAPLWNLLRDQGFRSAVRSVPGHTPGADDAPQALADAPVSSL